MSFLIFIPFFVLLTIHIIGEWYKSLAVRYITKPLLMPSLVIIYLLNVAFPEWLLVVGLLAGMVGDIFLMLPKKSNFFTAGLFAFLVGHIMYIILFLKSLTSVVIQWYFWALVGCYLLYLIFLYRLVKQNIGNYLVAGFVYFTILCVMSLLSFMRIFSVSFRSAITTYFGTILFIASDSVLAGREFRKDFPHSQEVVMITYATGQFLIMLGFLI